MRCRGLLILLLLVLPLVLPELAAADTYGFSGFGGLTRKNVTVVRRLAPDVQLADVSIAIQFPSGSSCLDKSRFTADLENFIAQGGRNIQLSEHPAYDIRMNVSSCERARTERKTEGKNTTNVPIGNASVVFQLIHVPDGKIVYSGTESYTVGQGDAPAKRSVFGVALPGNLTTATATDDQLAAELNEHLARRVASHLVVTPEQVSLPLAKGPDLDDADKLALALRWNEYLEKLSILSPRPAPADDAYRLYDMGVANEALGYAAEEPKTTLKYLREASIDYSRASEAKPTEKYFTESHARIERALTRYTMLDERQRQTQKLQAEDAKAATAYATKKKAGGIDNSDIIKLVQARVPQDIIVNRIRTAPTADFDLSTDGIVELSRAGVTGPLLNEMTTRMSSTDSAPAGTATTTASGPATTAKPARKSPR